MSDLYCYFGSNWAGKAEGESILDIFYKYNIAFAGFNSKDEKELNEYNNFKDKFKAGTNIAIANGKTVIAVGIAETDLDSLDNLNIDLLEEEKERCKDYDDLIKLAVKVKLFKLEKDDYFSLTTYIPKRLSNINDEDIKTEIDKRLKKYSGEKLKKK